LSPEKRITKQQMKEDKLVNTAFKASEYIQQNRNIFIGGAVAIAAIIAIIYYINYSIQKKSYDAEILFGKAQLSMAMRQPALAINQYNTIIDEYESTISADRACYNLGKVYFDQNNCDSAIFYFDKYINEYGKTARLLVAAHVGAANCFEQQNNFEKAGDYYFSAAELSMDDDYSPGYYMAAGRAFNNAKQFDKAQNSYQQIVDNYNTSRFASQAKEKLVEAKYRVQVD